MTEDTPGADLDETRRLLYMALAKPRTKSHELVGTLTNAICHHEGNLGGDPEQVMDLLVQAVKGKEDGVAFVEARLAELNSA